MENICQRDPKPQEIYRHFKGDLYQIITLAKHTETNEMMVVYQALSGKYQIYVRPLAMFLEKTDRDRYPEADQEYRFMLLNENISTSFPMSECERSSTSNNAIDSNTFISVRENSPLKNSQAGKIEIQPEKSEQQKEKVLQEEKVEPQIEENEEEFPDVDPQVMRFLNAQTYEERLQILAGLRHRITDNMITTMAISLDLDIGEGEPEERYSELRGCLQTMSRFEVKRLH
ncbi:MAG: DUF1653 domain-containing protein [Lachnospiraceae bacterium]|nr:DUF1653 domain-containing protein [Lachnospiraceae bacterium]